jgi:CheY-like chemotaxis protein
MNEDLRLFSTGLHALVSTFSIVLEDTADGEKALTAVESALLIINNTLNPPQESEDMTTTTTPPAVEQAPRLDAVRNKLESLTYSVTEAFNGDAFHIVDAHQRLVFDDLTLDQLVMTLNMCRVVRNSKEARLTVDQRLEVAALHPDFVAPPTKKAQRERLSELEKALEDQHGKYGSKATLTKVKFDTSVSYSSEWLDKVTGFADALLTRDNEVADGQGGVFTVTLTDTPLESPPLPSSVPAVEYMDTEDVPEWVKSTSPAGGEVDAYIDTHTNERIGVDSKGRCWRKPLPVKDKLSPLDIFMKR